VLQRLPLILLILLLPLAVAGHNIGGSVAGLLLLAQIYLRRRDLALADLAAFRIPLLASAAFVGIVLLAGALNPRMPAPGWGRFLAGYLIWCVLPPVAVLAQPPLNERDGRALSWFLVFVTLVLGALALAQAAIGFKLQGVQFVAGPTRAQGFYSHPLTLAYIGLLLFPAACGWLSVRPRALGAWVMAAGSAAICYASQSRTVQAIAVVTVLANVLARARGKVRIAAVAGTAALVLLIASTDNAVRHRFEQLSSGADVRSGYAADDRLAFWHAHWLMLTDSPLIGHGDRTDTGYRLPYYEAIGLGRFERPYEAHNTYLQAAVNGGMLGLTALLIWLAWHLAQALTLARGSPAGAAAFQALLAWCAGAVTQNAFQDSEVRYALTVLATMLWLIRLDPELTPEAKPAELAAVST